MNVSHSGSLGDLVYSLSAALALKEETGQPIHFYVKPNVPAGYYPGAYHPYGSVLIPTGAAEQLLPLLRSQPYLAGADVWKDQPIDVRLDAWRDLPIDFRMGHLGRYPFWCVSVCRDLSLPWLFVSGKRERRIVVTRSFRYRNRGISYGFLRDYVADLLFVGMEEEYVSLRREVPGLEWAETHDHLQLAELIGSARFFVGNQTFAYALAEGLKVPRVLEVFPEVPNVSPIGADAWDAVSQGLFENIVHKLAEKFPKEANE